MLKKLLILPLVGGLMSFGAFASADSNVCTITLSTTIQPIYDNDNQVWSLDCDDTDGDGYGDCSYTPNTLTLSENYEFTASSFSDFVKPTANGFPVSDFQFGFGLTSDSSEQGYGNFTCGYYSPDSPSISSDGCSFTAGTTLYFANADSNDYKSVKLTGPFTACSSNGGGDSSDISTVFPSVPSSFTSGITSLVSNFGSTIVGRLPSVILVAMGIFAIFALFRVVRNYARSSFRG